MRSLRFAMCGGGNEHSHGRRLFNLLCEQRWQPIAWVPTIVQEEFDQCVEIAQIQKFPVFWRLAEALDHVRPDVLVVASPNSCHYEQTLEAAERRIPVICEKPFTTTLDQAQQLLAVSQRRRVPLFVNYSYTGFRALTQLRQLLQSGELGNLQSFELSFRQNWLRLRDGEWRVDPKKGGELGAIIDIGTHLHDLIGFVTSSRVSSVACRRMNKDRFLVVVDAELEIQLNHGPRGVLSVSQIADEENAIELKLQTDSGRIHWNNGEPETLKIYCNGASPEIRGSGSSYPAMPIVFGRCAKFIDYWQTHDHFPKESRCRTAIEGLDGMKFLAATEQAWSSSTNVSLD